MEKWQKRIWFVNGILILIGLIFYFSNYGYKVVNQYYIENRIQNQYSPTGPLVNNTVIDSVLSKKDTLAKQDVFVDELKHLGSPSFYIVPLKAKDLKAFQNLKYLSSDEYNGVAAQASARLSTLEGRSRTTPIKSILISAFYNNSFNMEGVVNFLFLNKNTNEYHYLLKEKGYISKIDFQEYSVSSNEPIFKQNFILYSIALKDTDRDGRISNSDDSHLYVSNLFGENFYKILPDSVNYKYVLKNPVTNELIIFAEVIPNDSSILKSDWRQVVFSYSINKNELNEFISSKMLNEGKRILWGK